jgi:hypothetical protein
MIRVRWEVARSQGVARMMDWGLAVAVGSKWARRLRSLLDRRAMSTIATVVACAGAISGAPASVAADSPIGVPTVSGRAGAELVFRLFGPGDSVPPVTTLTPSPSSSGFVNSNVTVSLTATDPPPASGVQEIRYSVSMGSEQVINGSSGSFVLSSDGVHSIAYWAIDRDGNVEAVRYATVRIDKTAPVVEADWVSGVLHVDAEDSLSGLSAVRYSIDGGSTQTYTSPVSMPLGASKVSVWAVDLAGNSSTPRVLYSTRFLKAVVPAATSVIAGNSISVRVDLNAAAPVGGLAVALAASSPILPVPATVTVPAGALTVSTTVVAGSVSSAQTVQLTASLGGVSVGSGVMVLAPVPTILALTPTVVTGGSSVVGKVTLSGKAPVGGLIVSLSSGDPSAANVPATVTVPSGLNTASFTLTTSVVDTDKAVLIRAEASGEVAVAVLPVRRILPKSLTIAPISLSGGTSCTGTLTLTAPAPSGGLLVPLSSSDPAASVPASVRVNAGATTATFAITTVGVTSTRVSSIQAKLGGGMVRAPLTVLATKLAGVAVSSTVVLGGEGLNATITLAGKAPAGGFSVMVRSGNFRVQVPATVVVPAGATSMTFSITTVPGSASTTVTLLVMAGLDGKTATFTLMP